MKIGRTIIRQFLKLTDTPASMSGQAGKGVKVDTLEQEFEWTSLGVGTFLQLTDTPTSYSGQALKVPRVKSAEDALEFTTVAGDLSWARHFKIGRYYFSPLASLRVGLGNLTLVANRLYATPFPLPVSMTFDRIGLYIVTGAAGNIRLGICNDDGIYPGALRRDAGIINCSTTGLKVLTISQTPPAGLLWLVLVSDVTPTIRGSDLYYHSLLGTADGNSGMGSYYVSQAYNGLPDPYPAGGTMFNRILFPSLRRSA